MPKKHQNLRKTIKFLSVCNNPRVVKGILKSAPDRVIKAVCNAAINAAQGDVNLNRTHKKVLSTHRAFINSLIQKGEPVKRKRQILVQKGGFVAGLVLPIILSSVLSAVGSRLFGGQ